MGTQKQINDENCQASIQTCFFCISMGHSVLSCNRISQLIKNSQDNRRITIQNRLSQSHTVYHNQNSQNHKIQQTDEAKRATDEGEQNSIATACFVPGGVTQREGIRCSPTPPSLLCLKSPSPDKGALFPQRHGRTTEKGIPLSY